LRLHFDFNIESIMPTSKTLRRKQKALCNAGQTKAAALSEH